MTDNMKPVRCGCGGEAECVFYTIGTPDMSEKVFEVGCKKCETQTRSFPTATEAIEAWNRAMGATDTNVGGNERTAKVKDLERRSETSLSWEGICTNCGAYTMHEMDYCFHCGCRLEWK